LGLPADKKVADTDLNTEELKEIVEKFKAVYKNELGEDFPQDPMKQLWGAIDAVFHSWMGEKAVKYREVEKISNIYGTAVNVVQMVFGNMGETSGTGVVLQETLIPVKMFFTEIIL
jgi:pyruvate,orthophosphate dikinase